MKCRGLSIIALACSFAQASDYAKEREAILSMAGCFQTDYSFVETEALKEGYVTDPKHRVYDATKNGLLMDYAMVLENTDNNIRIQHVLIALDAKGNSLVTMKHQAENWVFSNPISYEFIGPDTWQPSANRFTGGWTREITDLDGGLRYQCYGAWNTDGINPEWNCNNFAPIPGRETRDMGRRDYNTLDRSTRIVVYPSSWLERQNNVKTIWADGVKTPLAREEGKTFSIRLPAESCGSTGAAWAEPRRKFWNLVDSVWATVLTKDKVYKQHARVDGQPRWALINGDIEERYYSKMNDAASVESAKSEILAVIQKYIRE